MRLLRTALLLALGCFAPTLLAQDATTTTLAITAAGSPVTTTRQGTVVTLTATVLSSGIPVVPGSVTFCEIKTQPLQCTDLRLLGTVQLSNDGIATLNILPGPGVHTYQAVFLGTHLEAASASTSSTLSVTQYSPTITTLASSGAPGNYSLTATVTATGGTVPPTGSISFMDTSNANYLLATSPSLVPGPAANGLLSTYSSPEFTSASSPAVAMADLNGDGKPDVVAFTFVTTGSTAGATVNTFLGNGDGTFTPKSTFQTNLANVSGVAFADFNGDGKLDMALTLIGITANFGQGSEVLILLGNGDGTFTPGQTLPYSDPWSIVTGDFNGDGNTDLAIENNDAPGSSLRILLGNGFGTFAPGPTTFVPSILFAYMQPPAVGDFNNDGNTDLALFDPTDNTLDILLGKGDGSFTQTPLTPALNSSSGSIVAADFNGDGKLDLAVASFINQPPQYSVTTYIGNGNGTFTPQLPISLAALGNHTYSNLVFGDFNYDGKADLAIASTSSTGSLVGTLLGNGNGTFAALNQFPASQSAFIAAADFNGDAHSDLALGSYDNATTKGLVQLLLSSLGSSTTSTATVNGISIVGTGTHQVDASYSGDTSDEPGLSANLPLTAQPVSTTLALTAVPTTNPPGQQATLIAALTPTTPQQNHSATGTVTFSTGATIIGTVPITSGVATFNKALLPIGTDTITATYSGDTNFATSTTSANATVALPPTTTTLTITSGGNPVTASREGTVITLTATVLSGSTPIKPGQVNFCEVSAALQCTDIRLLGSVQLNSTGTAIFSFFPGPGAHTYQAVFLATRDATASASALSTLSVSPYYPTTTTLTSTGSPGNYSLTATVTTSGGTVPPTGSITFMDTSNANYVLATASPLVPGPPTFGLHLAPAPRFPGNPSTGNNGSEIAITDLNGDGKLDVALSDEGDAASTAVLLGNEDGTFTVGPKVPPIGQAVALAVAVNDFNGDGKPDIAASAQSPGRSIIETQIFLGNGDGTFTVGQALPVGGAPIIATGDFNNDGIPDIIVESATTTQLSILLGNGDGTFTSQVLSAAASFPDLTEIAVGDLNGDGIPDLALANQEGIIEILLSNGDGTFRTSGQTLPQLPVNINGIAIADFNRDGKSDLVVQSPTGVSVLLGNSDGTFAPPSQIYTLPSSEPLVLQSIAVGDFNGDGIADLALGSGDFVRVLLGNGNATFASPYQYPISGLGGILAAADLNGDGLDDISFVGAGETLLSEVGTQSATATLSGISIVGTGTHQVDASYSGDVVYQPSTSATIPLTAQPTPTTLTLTANPATVNFGQSVALIAMVAPATPQQNHLPGGTVTFSIGTTVLGTGPATNGVAIFNTTLLPTGIDTITATYSGDNNFTTSTASTRATVNPPSTTTTLAITAAGIPATTIKQGTAITLTATVLFGNNTPVIPGQVTFCDASAAPLQCTDLRLLGTAQLSRAGTATFSFVPGPGTHTYQAQFLGTHAAATSSSNNATLAVTFYYPTATVLTSSGSPGNYTLAASVTTFGSTDPPTGTISFQDTSNANYPLATTATLTPGPATQGLAFAYSSPQFNTQDPPLITVADFNGDGKPDMAAISYGDYTKDPQIINILLGNGDGSFSPPLPVPIVPVGDHAIPYWPLVADFNGDGKLDMAVYVDDNNASGQSASRLQILLGNGDGTFTKGQTITNGQTMPFQQFIGTGATSDFNGDGIPDLALIVEYTPINISTAPIYSVTIFLGNGDGTFTVGAIIHVPNPFNLITVGDFNRDGKPDLALPDPFGNTLTILLGNGDGTFTPSAQNPATSSNPDLTVAADFNGDGILDLAVLYNGSFATSSAWITILFGNGDGTFTPGPPISLASLNSIVASFPFKLGDFNGDGKPDLALNDNSNNIIMLFGNGDGTFSAPAKFPANLPLPFTYLGGVADFNGDGVSDVSVGSVGKFTSTVQFPPGQVAVLLSNFGASATATVTGTGISVVGTGPHAVDAAYSGNTEYRPSVSATIPLTAQPAPTSLTLSASPTTILFGQQVTLTAVLTPNTAQNHSATGTVTFKSGSTVVGTGAIVNGTATATTILLPAGNDSVTATYSGDTNFASTTSATPVVVRVAPPDFTILLSSPTITLATYQHTTTTVTLTSIGAFFDSVAIACVNPPTYVTCIFTPQSATLTGNSTTTVSFYLDTDSVIGGANGPLHASRTQPPSAISLALLLSPFTLFAALGFRRRNKSRRAPLLLLAILALPITLALTSCGGSQITPVPSAAPGTYTITIAASGATTGVTHTAQLTLTVTP